MTDAGREGERGSGVPGRKRARSRHPDVAGHGDLARQAIWTPPPGDRLDGHVDDRRGRPDGERVRGRPRAGPSRPPPARATRRRPSTVASSSRRATGGSSRRRAPGSECGRPRHRRRDPGARSPRPTAAGATAGLRIRPSGSSRGDPMRRQQLAAIVALIVGTATIVFADRQRGERVPARSDRAGLCADRRRCAWYGVLRRGVARVAGLGVAGAGARRRAGGDRRRWDAVRRSADPRRAPGVAGGVACRVRDPRRSAARRGAEPRGAVLQPASPAAGRPSASSSPTRRAHAGSSRSSSARPGISRRSSAARSSAAPTRWRWPAATARRRSSRRSRPSASLPYACIPAGTRNHFALDLGVDRDDVVGALDAFVDGGERTVDLAEVNGRVFVNNVSLGRLRRVGPETGIPRREDPHDPRHRAGHCSARTAGELDLRWTGPGGQTHHAGAMVLVSNNRYRLGRAVGSGTRPRIDDGLLGVTVVGEPRARRAADGCSARCANGRRRRSRSTPTNRSPPASTAKRCASIRR